MSARVRGRGFVVPLVAGMLLLAGVPFAAPARAATGAGRLHIALIAWIPGVPRSPILHEIVTPSTRLSIAEIATREEAPAVARKLVAAGAQRIELSGSAGAPIAAAVHAAIQGRAAVGVVMNADESLRLLGASSQGAAGFIAKDAFICLTPGVRPALRVMRTVTPSFVNVKVLIAHAGLVDLATRLLTKEGVPLIELYGGLGVKASARVIDLTGGAVAVGNCYYGYEGIEQYARSVRGR